VKHCDQVPGHSSLNSGPLAALARISSRDKESTRSAQTYVIRQIASLLELIGLAIEGVSLPQCTCIEHCLSTYALFKQFSVSSILFFMGSHNMT
jgi:hypothetical protein